MKTIEQYIKQCIEFFNSLELLEKTIIVIFIVLFLVDIFLYDPAKEAAINNPANVSQVNEYVIENEVDGVKQTITISGENLSISNK